MSITLEQIELFLIILVRMSGFMITAPFFSLKNVPQKVKAGVAICISILLLPIVPYEALSYHSVLDYFGIVATEMLAGVMMGFFANIVFSLLI